jgi:hypothetical protein
MVELAELPPAFALSFAAAVVVSLLDREGQAQLAAAGVGDELDQAGSDQAPR